MFYIYYKMLDFLSMKKSQFFILKNTKIKTK